MAIKAPRRLHSEERMACVASADSTPRPAGRFIRPYHCNNSEAGTNTHKRPWLSLLSRLIPAKLVMPGCCFPCPAPSRPPIPPIICLSVNDAFAMFQRGRHVGAKNVFLLPDGNGEFTRKMGMLVDQSNLGFGMRSWRSSMLVDLNGKEAQGPPSSFRAAEVLGCPTKSSECPSRDRLGAA